MSEAVVPSTEAAPTPKRRGPHLSDLVPLTEEQIEAQRPHPDAQPGSWVTRNVDYMDALCDMALYTLALPAPCGHPSQYSYSEDGGKNIVCLLCERKRLLDVNSAGEALRWMEKHGRSVGRCVDPGLSAKFAASDLYGNAGYGDTPQQAIAALMKHSRTDIQGERP